MKLRVREICKLKGITMKELAEKMGINPITLSQSLYGNPTLSRLMEVARILDVDVADLFRETKPKNDVHGCIYINGEAFLIKNVNDLKSLSESISTENEKLISTRSIYSSSTSIWEKLFKDPEIQSKTNTEKTTI